MKYRSGLRRDVLNVGCCRSLLVAALLLSLTSVGAQPLALRVIDEEAIPFAGFLSKVEFDQRYPGKIVAEPAELDGGWYVIYEHETLNYYFGPILLRSTGEDYFAQLEEIVEAAVAQRPGINGYRLELSYEPSRTWSSPRLRAEQARRVRLPRPFRKCSHRRRTGGFWTFSGDCWGCEKLATRISLWCAVVLRV